MEARTLSFSVNGSFEAPNGVAFEDVYFLMDSDDEDSDYEDSDDDEEEDDEEEEGGDDDGITSADAEEDAAKAPAEEEASAAEEKTKGTDVVEEEEKAMVCPKCTLNNDTGSRSCEACDYSGPPFKKATKGGGMFPALTAGTGMKVSFNFGAGDQPFAFAPPSPDFSAVAKVGKCPLAVHAGVGCDGCDTQPITGTRFNCTVCDDFDYCEACEASKPHPHPFVAIKRPEDGIDIISGGGDNDDSGSDEGGSESGSFDDDDFGSDDGQRESAEDSG